MILLQAAVVNEVEIGASRKVFDLRLAELGPYNIDFSRSGRYMLIGGQKGHLGLMDWQSGHTFCEVQVNTAQEDSCIVLQATQCICAAFVGHEHTASQTKCPRIAYPQLTCFTV